MTTESMNTVTVPQSTAGATPWSHAAQVVATGLQSLQQSSQTFEERRALHRQYQAVLRGLREAVASSPASQASASSASMLALYEVRAHLPAASDGFQADDQDE